MRVAVIVNDMSEVNIDAALVRDGNSSLSRTDEALVEMSNGCICCTLREDLLVEVGNLARDGRFDYLVIESSGISEPLPVAQTFTFEQEDGSSLSTIAKLDTMVSVIDAAAFLRDFRSPDDLKARQMELGEDDERNISDLLLDQVEFADVLVINKADFGQQRRAGSAQRPARQAQSRRRPSRVRTRPGAARSRHGHWPFRYGSGAAQRRLAQRTSGEHTPETEEYGITSFVWRARRPMASDRFMDFLQSPLGASILRAKGFMWLATRPRMRTVFHQAGTTCRTDPGGMWWALVPRDQWPVMSPNSSSTSNAIGIPNGAT